MKYWRYAAVSLFSALFFIGCATGGVKTPTLHQRPAGFWENEKAVVQVVHAYYVLSTDDTGMPLVGPDGNPLVYRNLEFGTGAVLDVNGLVITNNHVVTPTPKPNQIILSSSLLPDIFGVCTVIDGMKRCEMAEVIFKDQSHDLTLVYSDQHFRKAIKLAQNEPLRGDAIYLWGNVQDLLPPSPFFGYYSGLLGLPYYPAAKDSAFLPIMMADINVSYGTSGGPVFNEEGECIAIAVAFLNPSLLGSRSLPFLIPLSTIREFLSDWTHSS